MCVCVNGTQFKIKIGYILFVINRIVCEHFTILAVCGVIWMLDFNDATCWIHINDLPIFATGLLFFTHRTASHHHLHALILYLSYKQKKKRNKKYKQRLFQFSVQCFWLLLLLFWFSFGNDTLIMIMQGHDY